MGRVALRAAHAALVCLQAKAWGAGQVTIAPGASSSDGGLEESGSGDSNGGGSSRSGSGSGGAGSSRSGSINDALEGSPPAAEEQRLSASGAADVVWAAHTLGLASEPGSSVQR